MGLGRMLGVLHVCMSACLCLLVCIYVCFRPSIFSWAVGGRVVMGLRLSRKFPESIQKRDSPSCSAERGCPWHHSHSPTVSDPVAVSVACCCFLLSPIGLCLRMCMCTSVCLCFVSMESFFHTCYGSPPKLCNLEALVPPHTAPACTSSFSDYLGSHWQSIVCCTDMLFVYRGS